MKEDHGKKLPKWPQSRAMTHARLRRCWPPLPTPVLKRAAGLATAAVAGRDCRPACPVARRYSVHPRRMVVRLPLLALSFSSRGRHTGARVETCPLCSRVCCSHGVAAKASLLSGRPPCSQWTLPGNGATPAGGGRLLSGARVSTAAVADALRTARNGAAPGLFRATALWHDYRHCGGCYRDGKQLRASDNRRENEMGETANLVAGYQNRRRGKQAAQSAKRGKQAAQSANTCKSGQSPRPQRRGKSRLRRGGKTRPALRPPTARARGRYQGASSPPTPQ